MTTAMQEGVRQPEKTERRAATVACTMCRRKKIKCDGEKPICSNCQLYHAECIPGQDRRRRSFNVQAQDNSTLGALPVVDSIHLPPETREILSAHAGIAAKDQPSSLDHEVQDHYHYSSFDTGMDFNFNDTETGDAWGGDQTRDFQLPGRPNAIGDCYSVNPLETLDQDLLDEVDNAAISAAVMESLSNERNTFVDFLNTTPRQPPWRDDATTSTERVRTFSNNQDPPNNIFEDSVDDELTTKLTCRYGSLKITDNGQLRYYGVTSNLHMMGDEIASVFQPTVRNPRKDAEEVLRQTGYDWEPDPVLENHLLNLYFAWHHPIMQEMERDLFFREREAFMNDQETSFYSPALENAMLAVGAMYAGPDDEKINSNSSTFFATRAKTYLDIELDSPTIATAQAILNLSGFEAAQGQDSRGWVYAGMMAQVVTDLGIHVSSEVDSRYLSNALSAREVTIRRKNFFWAAFTASVFWGFYSGRPSLLSSIKHNVSSPTSTGVYKWTAYGVAGESVRPLSRPGGDLLGLIPACFAQLAMKMGTIAALLYTGVHSPIDDVRTFAQSMSAELEDWYATLPPALQVDTTSDSIPDKQKEDPMPVVIQLHIQYHAVIILLHRPFVSDMASPRAQSEATLDACQTCTRSAVAITRLLRIFRRRQSWRYVHLQSVHNTTIAGVVHAYDTCMFPGERGRQAQEGLSICVQALGEMAQSFKSAMRGYEVISAVRREWQMRRWKQAGEKRPRGMHRSF
ncbi:hypothetical protein EDD37DRAFT_611051 [Exophiala viscosa]|uniref:uncharacterized protein n=1 Tax=Exophiala viscosa TaxID=2486360 RepID=UPI002194C137|nr:hypothetical protein EDD37DRAFT_611051 [Exophiala viscosa]